MSGTAQNPDQENSPEEAQLEDAAQESGVAADGVPPVVDAYEVMQIRLADLEAELEQAKDRQLRALAEAENTRRRGQKDRDDAQRYGGVKLARDILPVLDNLQRAIRSVSSEQRELAADVMAGVELTERELIGALEKNNIMRINPEIGDKFDANQHQAMFEAPVPGAEKGTIIEVIQEGFVCHDRLIRAATVGVARAVVAAPAGDASEPEAES